MARYMLMLVVLTACRGPATTPIPTAPESLLVLAGSDTVLSIDVASGATVWRGPAVTPLGAASPLFSTTRDAGATLLESRDPATGSGEVVARIPGAWDVRAVSRDGSQLALLAPHPAGVHPWTPIPRSRTPLVVITHGETQRFDLMGNLEPEAFSVDGTTLFMIRHLPADAPRSYRVVALELATGNVFPVTTGAKKIVETMAGTRLSQAPSPSGHMLFTLYRSAGSGDHAAFVHVLSLDERWAHCIGLPEELWGGDPAQQAIAVSPDGRSVYVVDVGRGVLVELDPEELTVGAAVHVGSGRPGQGPARMTVAPGGRIIVANGRTLTTVDATTMEVIGRASLTASATGIGADRGGRALYVATDRGVEVLDLGSAARIEVLPGVAGNGPVEVSALPA